MECLYYKRVFVKQGLTVLRYELVNLLGQN